MKLYDEVINDLLINFGFETDYEIVIDYVIEFYYDTFVLFFENDDHTTDFCHRLTDILCGR